jgi:hypothetical protein
MGLRVEFHPSTELHPPAWVPLQTLAQQTRLSDQAIRKLVRLGVLPATLTHRCCRMVEPYSAWELLKIRARFRYSVKVIEDYVAATGITELSYVNIVRFVAQQQENHRCAA